MCDAEKEQVPAVIESIIYYLQLAETNVEEKGYVPMLDLLMRHHEDCQQPSCECRTLLLVYKEQHQEWNGIRQAYQLVICILDNFIVHNRRITLPYILKFFVLMKLGLTVRAAATASRVLSLNL